MSSVSSAMLLFLVLDPFGNIPAFVSVLAAVDPRRRTRIVIRELLIALAVLLLFLFSGRYVLALMHISEPSLTIAGGILMFLIALRMVFPSAGVVVDDPVGGEPLIVPLAIPFIAGPSALATVLLIGSDDRDQWLNWIAAVIMAWFAAGVIMVVGTRLAEVLGKRVLIAVERLMGMLLVAIAVEMFLGGMTAFWSQHGRPS